MKTRWIRGCAVALAVALLMGVALSETAPESEAPIDGYEALEIVSEDLEIPVEEADEFALTSGEDTETPDVGDVFDEPPIEVLPLDPGDIDAFENALGSIRLCVDWTVDQTPTENPGSAADGLYTFVVAGPEGISQSVQIAVIGGEARTLCLNDLPLGEYTVAVQVANLPTGVCCVGGEGLKTLEAGHTPESPLEWRFTFDVTTAPPTEPVTAQAKVLAVGERYVIDPSGLFPGSDTHSFSFSASDRRVLRVTASGEVHALREGTAVVTVIGSDGEQVSVEFNVAKAPKRISLGVTRITLGMGQAAQIAARVSPADSLSDVTYASSETAVACVDANGRVIGMAAGSAVITATTRNNRQARCAVTVKPAPQAMTFSRSTLDMNVGTALRLTLQCDPADAWAQARYSSSDPAVASVDTAGRITAKQPGRAIITAQSWNGLSDSCTVNVWEAPTKITLDADKRTLGVGQVFTLKATVESASGNPSVRWSSSSRRVATVSGGEVTACGVGEATITARTSDGKYASCVVTVKKAPESVKVTARRVSMGIGGITFVQAVLEPSDSYSDLAWRVEGDAVTLSDDGMVTAVAEGAGFIYATAYNGVTGYAMIDVSGEPDTGRLTGIKIGIDPGHQRKANSGQEQVAPWSSATKAKVSSGTAGISTRVPEYIVVLDVGLKLRDTLESMGATVYMTRTTHDVDISNKERAIMMNNYGVDLMLRLHCDGMSNSGLQGIGLYTGITAPSSAESLRAAHALMPQMLAATGAMERGIYQTDKYTGNNWSVAPCVLVELGYMTNPTEDRKLNDPEYQQKLAEGMAEGICDFMGR